jgi:hypothetical protein
MCGNIFDSSFCTSWYNVRKITRLNLRMIPWAKIPGNFAFNHLFSFHLRFLRGGISQTSYFKADIGSEDKSSVQYQWITTEASKWLARGLYETIFHIMRRVIVDVIEQCVLG